jgi:hypothetical protein
MMKTKKVLTAAGLVTAGIVAGCLVSVAGVANAADTTSTTASASTATTAPTAPSFGGPNGAQGAASDANFNPGGADPVRSDEKAVASEVSARLIAAAEARVSGATAFRAETDGDGAAYEVHMKKADGTLVTVKFDSSFNITAVEDGMGAGGPGGHGGDGDGDGPAAGTAPATPSTTQTN